MWHPCLIFESVFLDFVTETLRKNYSRNLTEAAGKLVSNYASEHGYIFQEPFETVSIENMLEYFSIPPENVIYNKDGMPMIKVSENFDFEIANKMGWRKQENFQIEPYLMCKIEKQYLPKLLYAKLDHPKFKNNVDDFIETPIKVYVELSIQNGVDIVCFDAKKNLIADYYIYNTEEKQMYLHGGIHHRSVIKTESI